MAAMPLALAGVDVKLRRALVHLDALRAELAELVDVTLKGAVAHRLDDDPDDPEWKLLKWTGVPPLDPMIGAVLGDFAHNVRSALDQLVWVLVQLNGGIPGRHTYWPVFDDAVSWQDKIVKPATKGRATATSGISAAALQLVEQFQPFQSNAQAVKESPLLRVHDLWNADKHRTLHVGFPFPSQMAGLPTFQPEGYYRISEPQKPERPLPIQEGAVFMRFKLEEVQPIPEGMKIVMTPPGAGLHLAFYAEDKFVVGLDHLDPMLADARKVYDAALQLPEVKAAATT